MAGQVTEHCPQSRCAPRCPLARSNHDLDGMEGRDVYSDRVDDRRRQCRQRAGSSDRHAIAPDGRGIHRSRETCDKFAAIGQVQVMRASSQGRLCHAIVLGLERPHAVNDEIRREGLELRGKIRMVDVHHGCWHTRSAGHWHCPPTRCNQFDPRLVLQRAGRYAHRSCPLHPAPKPASSLAWRITKLNRRHRAPLRTGSIRRFLRARLQQGTGSSCPWNRHRPGP